jgi:hypothetical protein
MSSGKRQFVLAFLLSIALVLLVSQGKAQAQCMGGRNQQNRSLQSQYPAQQMTALQGRYALQVAALQQNALQTQYALQQYALQQNALQIQQQNALLAAAFQQQQNALLAAALLQQQQQNAGAQLQAR